jgi:hypothetical protein
VGEDDKKPSSGFFSQKNNGPSSDALLKRYRMHISTRFRALRARDAA